VKLSSTVIGVTEGSAIIGVSVGNGLIRHTNHNVGAIELQKPNQQCIDYEFHYRLPLKDPKAKGSVRGGMRNVKAPLAPEKY
jgi:hypothetical protein